MINNTSIILKNTCKRCNKSSYLHSNLTFYRHKKNHDRVLCEICFNNISKLSQSNYTLIEQNYYII